MTQPTGNFVAVDAVVGEIEFQKKQMIEYLKSWKVDEETISMAADYFDVAIHGVEDHLEHLEV